MKNFFIKIFSLYFLLSIASAAAEDKKATPKNAYINAPDLSGILNSSPKQNESPETEKKSSIRADELSGMLYVSLQDNAMDWWFKLPADSIPHISQIKKIFINQNFSLYPFVSGAAVKDGNFRVSYSIDCSYPDGSHKSIVKDSVCEGKKSSPNIIVACPDVISVCFDNSYKEGKYIFTFSVLDQISGKTSKYVNDIDLVGWSAPNPFDGVKLVRDYVKFFYLQPSPEALWSILFSKDFNLEQKKSPNSLNYSYIGFLKAAFKRNDFLFSHVRDYFAAASPMNRAKIIFLMAVCDEPAIEESLLKEKEKKYQARIRDAKIPNPYKEWDAVMGAAQIDMLWGEFYADGTYKPLRRIIDLLSHSEDAVFADSFKSRRERPETQQDWQKFMMGLLYRAAIMTIAQHSYEMPLVEQYCTWALHNNDVPASGKEVLIPILQPENFPPEKQSQGENKKSAESTKPSAETK